MQVAGALEPQPEPGALLIIPLLRLGLGRERRSGPPPGASRAWAGARAPDGSRRPSPSPRHVTPPPPPTLRGQPRARAGGPGARKKPKTPRLGRSPPAQNSPQPGLPRIPLGPGRGKGRPAGPPPGPTWLPGRVGRGGEGGPRGRPACGSPSGSLGSPGCALRRDDGELLEFPAAGERGRPGERAERAAREGAPCNPTLGGAPAARVLGGDLQTRPPYCTRGRRHTPPSPAVLFGSGGGPVPPLPARAAERGQVQAAPLPQPPGFPLGPSPPPGVRSSAASSGRGRGWQGSGGLCRPAR